MKITKSTCCYCGVGCGVLIESRDNQIVDVQGDPDHPANYGRLCTKGAALHLSAGLEGRALFPEIRPARGLQRQQASWDEALDLAAERFARIIREHGPNSVAFYISGQLLTEDYYVFNKLAKGLIGTNNIDTNSRLCMSSAVAGYKATLGADAPPACYADIDHADCIFIAGANPAYAHPVLFRRLEAARQRRPEQKLIVVDPRHTDSASCADLHLPILPGTDVALFNAMLHVMIREDLCDTAFIEQHCDGFEALKELVQDYSPADAAGICGIPADDIVQAARWFGQARATLSLYCQGLNQSSHGTDKNTALIDLHLATGQIGRPGAGPFSLTGQPNAMGGREVGGMANLLSAHRDLNNPLHRVEVARIWGIETIPATPGKSAVEMFDALLTGEIKAIWIACTNPAQSMPWQSSIRRALAQAEFVVVQEAFRHTDTTTFADVLLPATTWGEKEGTVTNSERRITHLSAAVTGPGQTRHDWQIAVAFARRLGKKMERHDAQRLFPYETAEAIFKEHVVTTRGQDLDITGLSYALLDRLGPQQWPYPENATAGTPRLYENGQFPTANGRARFIAAAYQPVAEPVSARFPLHLNTGRLRDQWHGMSRTGTVASLFNHVEEPLLSMHPQDMAAREIREGDIIRLRSRRGELVIRVEASDAMRPGQVFLPMHWGSQFMTGQGSNALTTPIFDPISKQPELKHAAVQVEKTDYTWQMVILRKGQAAARRQAVQPLLSRFDYAAAGLYGKEEPVLALRMACQAPADPSLLAEMDTLLGLDDLTKLMRYTDPQRHIAKRVLIEAGQIRGVRLTGEVTAQAWLKEMVADGAAADVVRNWALAPVSHPPQGIVSRGRVICNCLNITAPQIQAALHAGSDFTALQAQLRCGTQCGSCVPQIRQMCAQTFTRSSS